MPPKKNTSTDSRPEWTLAERTEIIRENQRGVCTELIAARYGCSEQHVKRILRRKTEYLNLWAKSNNAEKYYVRRLHNPLRIVTGRIIYEWILRARHHMDVTDDKIREAGHKIAAHLGYPEFKLNNKWLSRLKDKYKLRMLDLTNYHKNENFDQDRVKTLDIGDIIETIRQDDPFSLYEYFKVLERRKENKPVNVIEPLPEKDSLPEIRGEEDIVAPDEADDMPMADVHVNESRSPYDQGIGMDDAEDAPEGYEQQPVTTYSEAIRLLAPIEDFALMRGNIRAVGLLNQLENLFKDEIANGKE